jgi:predicted DCC family thiol-disulfide oxidoreductase YuxK
VPGTLVYDADCGFCTASADWLSRHGDCAVTPWQALDLAALRLTEDEVTTAAYWLEGDTKRRGARAIAAALRTCGTAYRLLGRLIDLPPVRPVAAWGYGLVAKYRYRLPGGTNACRLPPR